MGLFQDNNKCTRKTDWRGTNYRDIGVVQLRDGGGVDQHDCVKDGKKLGLNIFWGIRLVNINVYTRSF